MPHNYPFHQPQNNTNEKNKNQCVFNCEQFFFFLYNSMLRFYFENKNMIKKIKRRKFLNNVRDKIFFLVHGSNLTITVGVEKLKIYLS